MDKIILYVILAMVSILFLGAISHYITNLIKSWKKLKSSKSALGDSTKIRLIHQLKEAIEFLSKTKTGAIITIENNDDLDSYRTDGIIIDANVSSSLIISIFNKHSPLHDGAIIIRNNKIHYASTYYKITKKSIDNKYGARHRAAMGISEICDATTIVVSEETGGITLAQKGVFTSILMDQLQETLVNVFKDND
ncbi:membrane protein [Metamycoplasma cloacale]|uniref:Diadenylate cyclase n=1 Tax=Metamycoplasma cloacale TaxID=92401 RepID=A0A2Z4LNV7_9BACT|nr:DNA integrity scanning protein DisA nucleotide-binding domain protein [Metamycoplasma cloacale]AWX42937.1 diadenylate cyclase [Metamycoplasma cloacale]VEU79239.1 membrane protein [Metamycoplasma cloacale]